VLAFLCIISGFVKPLGIITLPLFVTLNPSRADCKARIGEAGSG
jgi:hypothetical protein